MNLNSKTGQYIFTCMLSVLFSCYNSNKPNKAQIVKLCNSCCLNKLATLADTLKFDTSKSFDYYFNEKRVSLKDCNLKKFRGQFSLKSSLVLIWLKIDNVYLKHHWRYSYVQEIVGGTKTGYQIVWEFNYLVTKTDPLNGIEYLDPSEVDTLIKNDHLLLNVKQIANYYKANRLLRIHNRKKGT